MNNNEHELTIASAAATMTGRVQDMDSKITDNVVTQLQPLPRSSSLSLFQTLAIQRSESWHMDSVPSTPSVIRNNSNSNSNLMYSQELSSGLFLLRSPPFPSITRSASNQTEESRLTLNNLFYELEASISATTAGTSTTTASTLISSSSSFSSSSSLVSPGNDAVTPAQLQLAVDIATAVRNAAGTSGGGNLLLPKNIPVMMKSSRDSGGSYEMRVCIYQGSRVRCDLLLLRGGHRTPVTKETLAHIDTALAGSAEYKSMELCSSSSTNTTSSCSSTSSTPSTSSSLAKGFWHAKVDAETGKVKEPPTFDSGKRLQIGTKFKLEPGRANFTGSHALFTLKAMEDTLLLRVTILNHTLSNTSTSTPHEAEADSEQVEKSSQRHVPWKGAAGGGEDRSDGNAATLQNSNNNNVLTLAEKRTNTSSSPLSSFRGVVSNYYWPSSSTFSASKNKADVSNAWVVATEIPTLAFLEHISASKARATMLRLTVAPPPSVSIGHLFADSFTHRLKSLEETLKLRSEHDLRPQDVQYVERIGIALSLMVAHGVPLQRSKLPGSQRSARVERICNDGVLVMHRYWLWDGKYSAARLHLFADASETYIHNHSGNFISHNFSGVYEHTVFSIDHTRSGASHEVSERHSDGSLGDPVSFPGALVPDVVYFHVPHHTYFLSGDRQHTVSVKNAAGRAGGAEDVKSVGGGGARGTFGVEVPTTPTLTLFYKDMAKRNPTYVMRPLWNDDDASRISSGGASSSQEKNGLQPRVTTSSETPEDDPEVLEMVYSTLENCLRGGASSLRLDSPLIGMSSNSNSSSNSNRNAMSRGGDDIGRGRGLTSCTDDSY